LTGKHTAFVKRVKRQVSGKPRECFAVTNLGFEKLVKADLAALPLSNPILKIQPGGICFHGKLADLMLANLHLRMATRILMRLDTFKAESFFELSRKLSTIPWELFLYRNQHVTVNVTSHHSRLYHSHAVAQRIHQSIADRQTAMMPGATNLSDQQLFIRILKNRLTLSLNSSGESLYKRGLKHHGGLAPLRETFAAAILKMAGYHQDKPLIDPMCGSGSFSLEAAMMVKNIAPGLHRQFAFSRWPAFQPKRWRFLLNEAQSAVVHRNHPTIFASDNSRKATNTLSDCIKKHHLKDAIEVQNKNFFDLKPKHWTRHKGMVVINPPYGFRMKEGSNIHLFFSELVDKLSSDYKGWQVALLVPQHAAKNVRSLTLKTYRLTHGGLKVLLFYGRI
jgi:putative N6-adenine-specific DNA methylase